MPTIKIRYKKERKVFVPDREVDLPDNFEIDIPAVLVDKKMAQGNKISGQSNIKEDFIQYFLHKHPDKSINDIDKTILDLIGVNAEYSGRTSYKDDKQMVMEYLSEKYNA